MKLTIIAAALAALTAGVAWTEEPKTESAECVAARTRLAHDVREHRLELANATEEARGGSALHVFDAFRGLDRRAHELMRDLRGLERRCPGSVVFLKDEDVRKTADVSGSL